MHGQGRSLCGAPTLLDKNKKNLNMTERGDRSYWHIAITTLEDGSLAINLSRIGTKLSLKTFAFDWKTSSRKQ